MSSDILLNFVFKYDYGIHLDLRKNDQFELCISNKYPTCILSLYLIFHQTVPIDLTILEKNISYNFYTI